MIYAACGAHGTWIWEPEECLLPWTFGLHVIYAKLNGGRYVGMFGVSIV